MVWMISEVKREKKNLIKELKATLKPIVWESGYVRSAPPGKPLEREHVWIEYKGTEIKEHKLRGGYLIHEFFGFVQDGVIIDHCCAMRITYFDELPIEDLQLLKTWMTKKFPN